MREIKFRIYDPAPARMVHTGIQFNNTKMEFELVPGVILMQFTGLKDKNGKEIYEGDIRIGKFNVLDRKEEQIAYEVMIWDQNSLGFHWEKLKGSIPDFIEVEVIGNIYENPDLLTNIRG